MKKILLTLATVATLVSCSKEETVSSSREAIGFNNVFVENSTKAAIDPSFSQGATLTSFNVWGNVISAAGSPVSVFNNDIVEGSGIGSNTVWDCTTTTQYWIPTAKYHFAAVVNADKDDKGKDLVTLGEDLLPASIKYTVDDADEKDLLYAKSIEYEGKVSDNDLVAFSFDHLLSKAIFTVAGTQPNQASSSTSQWKRYSYAVKDIKINNATRKGTVAVDTKEWSSDRTIKANITTVDFADITGVFDNDGMECKRAKLLIPGEYTAKVSFTVDILYDDQVITTKEYKPSIAVDFKPGYSYNFTIAVGLGTPIQFTVSEINNWLNAPNNIPVVDTNNNN